MSQVAPVTGDVKPVTGDVKVKTGFFGSFGSAATKTFGSLIPGIPKTKSSKVDPGSGGGKRKSSRRKTKKRPRKNRR